MNCGAIVGEAPVDAMTGAAPRTSPH